MELFNHLLNKSRYLNRFQLIKESHCSKSQLYQWFKEGVQEKKSRECKVISEAVVKETIEVIRKYPHLGAVKGQTYMIYHQLGYIPHHLYKHLKKAVKDLVFHEVSKRNLLPNGMSYNHVRPDGVGMIWAEDFTHLKVCGKGFNAALVIEVKLSHYLGVTTSERPSAEMVEGPVNQALELTSGEGPTLFLLSDNGPQYVSTRHGIFLDKRAIIHKRIPSCKPEYNGSVECGIKEFKNVFYNVWADSEKQGISQGKPLPVRVQEAATETIRVLNERIPRPVLGGVTSMDAWKGVAYQRREINRQYLEVEQRKKEVTNPWDRKNLVFIRDCLFNEKFSKLELLTRYCFFLKRPLRQLTKLIPRVLGN